LRKIREVIGRRDEKLGGLGRRMIAAFPPIPRRAAKDRSYRAYAMVTWTY
jgi:hypothetical protein